MNLFPFRNTYNPYSAKREKELEEKRAIGKGASTDREIYDAGELPTMTVRTRRANKAPNTPGSRQSGRGRTYTRTTIG
jgi:hypothetical protein